ncbi:uncharacterized protein MONOS_1457 [Monocercomonoides exilis]|uniref:uncharacterized protein n=1 Tax=Monocercomonoides exilis TaxID=2049356 RepID=UPI0035596DB6|nr:hypothetical protein MONOS_1457 [Monocercomonoides exilis]|eukprot:MONOS_1457.1-p1 / transcript=MONOS_1457.1 / gene=MONOS_1457 / organism=Monocercomonoides_exilis_PA203 / gene_product=unspecified product / transcript_product=unspecified product / location=Mono_scaffold00026:30099-31933(+) / protein_length=492 / sequence_SO=supercontig / SO=protein_coding / is_pseudo=false
MEKMENFFKREDFSTTVLLLKFSSLRSINKGALKPCSSIFSLQNSYEIEVVGCTFQTLCSEGCKKGGAMSFELKGGDGQLKMRNVGVTNSICSSSEGCGGGIYLTCATDNNDRYSFSEISVGGNMAHQGRDMFIVANDLRNAFFGVDEVNFSEGIFLDKLLFEHTDNSIYVSSRGRDIHRSTSSAVPSSPGSSSSSCSSDEPSSDKCTINVGKAIQSFSEPSEAVLTNKLMLTFTSINFCLPSSFETQQKELLFTETGTATLNKCSFAMQTAEEGIAFVLFHVSSGTLSIEESKMAELSFATSAIRLSAPAAHFVASAFSVDVLSFADGSFISVGDAEEKRDEESVISKNGKETKAGKEASEIRLENLQWHLIRSTSAKASIISYESALSVELTMDNSTFSDCNSESQLGGAFCVWMKEKAGGLADSWANEGSEKANELSFVTCARSTSEGRGGAIVLKCMDNPEHSNVSFSRIMKGLPITFRQVRLQKQS